MKIVLIVDGGRPVPPTLTAHCESMGFEVRKVRPADTAWHAWLPEVFAVLPLLPAWGGGAYLNALPLWRRFLAARQPAVRLLPVSYAPLDHSNHLDLLRLEEYSAAWWEATLPVSELDELPKLDGIDLEGKLKRFFDGHGDDSVMAVLSRIRMVVQMAERELHKMQTPYPEIYEELVAPARLADKWREWRNRWVNYYPLFEQTPPAGRLNEIERAVQEIEAWMLAGGEEEKALANGTVARVLNDVREQLQYIEKLYVVQKLSPAYR